MDTLSNLMYQFGSQFQVFIPMIHRIVKKHNIKHSRYDLLVLLKSKSDDTDPIIKVKKPNRNMGLTATDTTSINRVRVSLCWNVIIL